MRIASGGVALIRDLSSYINDVADTVSLLQNLDLVICCETALGHISALAGKECWVPYSHLGRDYRIGLGGEQMLWTPKTKVFRQRPDNAWGPVFEEIEFHLQERINELDRAAGKASKVA